MPLDNDPERIAACRKLVAAGCAQAVALTLGKDGALLVTADHVWRAQPMGIEAVSTVGAGDSFLGGLIAALAKGRVPDYAFHVAVAAASAAVMSPGTELCRQEDVKRLLSQVTISELADAA